MTTSIDTVVVGAGYVGLTLAIHMANRGLSVLSVDIDKSKIATLRAGKNPIFETGIEEALQNAIQTGKLTFAATPPAEGASAWIIASAYIPGRPEHYLDCLKQIKGVGEEPPLISIRTTIPVGITRNMIIPALEKQFGGPINEKFFLSLCPERTLSGAAVDELANLPQLLGGTEVSVEKTKVLFGKAGIECIALPSFEASEVAKTFTNFYRFCQFNLANFFGVCCHRFGISEKLLRDALSADYARFQLPVPGAGVGGFCLPKDSLVLFDGLNYQGKLSDGGTPIFAELFEFPRQEYQLNDQIMHYFQESVLAATQKCRRILALGVAFKGVPATDDTRGSVGLRMVEFLQNAGKNVCVHDTCIGEEKLRTMSLVPAPHPLHMNDYDAVLLLNNHPKNRKIFLDGSATLTGRTVALYDPWRLVVQPKQSVLEPQFSLGN